MAEVNWALGLQQTNPGEAFMQALKAGQEQRARADYQSALKALAGNPSDRAAYGTVFQSNPELAMRIDAYGRDMQARQARSGMLREGNPDASPNALAAIDADPDSYLTFQGNRLEVDAKQLKSLRDVNDFGMQLLGGVSDQASYDAARQRAASIYAENGLDFSTLNLPEQYSPETVENLRMQGMNTSQQLAAIARENRLEWDIADDEADNARADASTASLDRYRQGQLANGRRGQDLTDRRGRRAQDIASQDRRRGQDLASSDRRRGQDMGGGRKGKGGPAPARAINPKTGQAIIFRSGKWVDEKTGQPVQ